MAMGTTTTTYTTIPLPKTTPNTTLLSALATKFRAFKLHAFKVAPAAFSVVYDAEAQLPLSTWLARITEPSTTILICVATSTQHQHCNDAEKEEDTQSKILLDGEWTGTFTMIGPITRQDYLFPLSGQPTPGPEGSETRWQLTTLFTLPAYRGHGIVRSKHPSSQAPLTNTPRPNSSHSQPSPTANQSPHRKAAPPKRAYASSCTRITRAL